MNENTKDVMTLLESRYKSVVEKDVETDERVDSKRKQFTSIRNTINRSVNSSLTSINSNHQIINTHFRKLNDKLKALFHGRLEKINDERDVLTHNYGVKKDGVTAILAENELENEHARKKVKNAFSKALKEADDTFNDIVSQTEAALERASTQHANHMRDLIESTNERLDKASTIETEAYTTFNKTHKAIEKKREDAFEGLQKEKEETLKQLRTDLQALKKDYKDNLKPLDEAIETLKTKQEKALNKLKESQNQAINKQESYKKEAEKLNDKANAAYHDKKIKQLKKEHIQALEDKENEHKETLDPELSNRDELINTYTQKFITFKHNAIDTILSLIKRYDNIQNDHNIELDHANNTLNKKLTEYEKEKMTIELDRKIQNVNFEYTLEETTKLNEHKQKIAQPEYTIKENEATLNRDLSILELDTTKTIYQQDHDTKIEIMQHNHQFHMDSLDNLSTKLNYLYEYDRDMLNHEKQKKQFDIDYQHERMLMSHYQSHAEGYAALKTEILESKKPAFTQEIDARLKQKTTLYNQLIKEAEKEHTKMIENIETTYKREKNIYEDPLEIIRKKHRAIMDAYLANQAKERANLQDQINELDENKHKKKVLKLKKDLSFLKHEQTEALETKKASLESARTPYKKMLDNIEKHREQSIEEAETLLYHTTDQYNLAIEEAKKQAREEKQTISNHYYEIKHRAKLFNTFQKERKARTLKDAESYHIKRNHDSDEKQTQSDTLLNEQLNKLKNYEASQKKALDETIKALENSFDDFKQSTLEEKETKRMTLKEAHQREKEKLDLQKEKLESAHVKALETLKEQFENDKEALFKEKAQNEETLDQKIQSLDKSIEDEINKKHDNLEAAFKRYETNVQALKSSVETNPFVTLDVQHIATLEEDIKQNK